jgi:hypothetical protein
MPVTARNHLEAGGDDALAVTAGIGPPVLPLLVLSGGRVDGQASVRAIDGLRRIAERPGGTDLR